MTGLLKVAFKREVPFITIYDGAAESYKQALFFGYYCLIPEIKVQVTFIRRWQWDYPDAVLFLFSQRQLRARPQHQNMSQLFPTLQDVLQKHPGLPQPPVQLT